HDSRSGNVHWGIAARIPALPGSSGRWVSGLSPLLRESERIRSTGSAGIFAGDSERSGDRQHGSDSCNRATDAGAGSRTARRELTMEVATKKSQELVTELCKGTLPLQDVRG